MSAQPGRSAERDVLLPRVVEAAANGRAWVVEQELAARAFLRLPPESGVVARGDGEQFVRWLVLDRALRLLDSATK